jgi:glyoxylase-like metal-dependent hydrolase (beta-lactamase superfamily II)
METPPKIKVGRFTVHFLTDGLWRNDGGCMLGVVPRELWKKDHPPDQQNRIRLNLTCPLVIEGNQAILIDCGIGNRLSDSERRIFAHAEGFLPQCLRAAGLEAGDITHVLLSHLHFDHCGGIVRRRKSGVLEAAFPRARIFVQRGELELALNSSNDRLRAAYRHVDECVQAVRSSIDPLDGAQTEVMAGLTAVVSGGHTTDHQVAIVRDSGESFIHLADIVPTSSHMRPAWNQAFDLDALTTMEQKAGYLKRAAAELSCLSFAHDDQIFAARVSESSGRFTIEQTLAVEGTFSAGELFTARENTQD